MKINIQHYFSVREERIKRKLPISKIIFSNEIKHITKLIDRNVSINDKVILIGNEPDPPTIGIFLGFFKEEFGPRIVKPIDGGDEYISFEAICKYSDELWKYLQNYPPLEIFNIISKPTSYVSEKYGIKYRHFRELQVTNEYDENDINLKYEYCGSLNISTSA